MLFHSSHGDESMRRMSDAEQQAIHIRLATAKTKINTLSFKRWLDYFKVLYWIATQISPNGFLIWTPKNWSQENF